MLAALARSAGCLANPPRNALELLPSNQHDSETSFVSLLNLGVNVMMCPEFLRETFLFRSASNGRDPKTHASRKLNSEVAKPANSLNSDELAGSGL